MTMMTFKGQGGQRPTAMGSLLQSSAYGATIPTIYGLTQSNLLAIWAANLRQGGGGTKKFKQLKKGITNYCENIDFLLGHNPIKGVLQIQSNGSNYPLAFTSQTFSGSGGRQSFAVTDPHFYFVIAVTVEASYSFDVDDYGSQGPATLAGTWEVPLWNELETGPDPTDPTSYRAWPYCYRWQPGMGATIEIDAESFPSGSVTIYYAQMTAATSYQPPTARLALEFEPHLGSGDEYVNAGSPYDTQQIIYPQFAGLQSSEIDLGSSGALPQLSPEVCGKWGVYSSGDADFVDMIEDIFKSGLAQAGIVSDSSTQPEPAGTQMERGLSSYNLPGTIQKKVDASADVDPPPMTYDMPNAAGNMLIVVATAPASETLTAGPNNSPIPGGAIYDGSEWEIAGISPNQLRTTGSATSHPQELGWVYFTDLGFYLPSDAVILGIEVQLDYLSQASTGAYINGAELCYEGGGLGTAKTINVPFEPYNQTMTEGGSSDLWGAALTAAVVNNSSFGFGFQMYTETIRTFVWHAYVKVWYSVPSGPTISSANGETWTPVYSDYGGFQLWTAAAVGGPNSITLGSAGTPWQMAILEIGGLGSSVDSSPPLGGNILDSIATALRSPATIESTVCNGLPGYLLAVSFYPGGGAVPVEDEPLWDAVTPENFFGRSPTTFQMQDRVLYSPGVYLANGAGGAPASICVIALKAVQPVPYPQPLRDFINLPSFDQVRAQCRAGGLWGSLTMNSQSSGSDWLKSLCMAADSAPVFLGAQLCLYPYSEVSAAANGAFYDAPSAAGPVANLDADSGDFTGDGPALNPVDRINLPNVLQMQCMDRNANYAQVTVQTPDPASLGLYGQRKADAITNNAVQDPGVARTLLGIAVRRNQYGGDVWEFSTTARWSLLSPMDLITITDRLQSVIGQLVRITEYNENDRGGFDGKAEPFVYGMCAPSALPATTPSSNPPQLDQTAGDVNPPIIFEPTPGLYPGTSAGQIWVVISSSSPNFGGAQVFLSTDGGNSYSPAPGGADGNSNVVIGSAVTGVLTADWPAASDPDTTNNLAVDLSESSGILQNYPTVTEDSFQVPCYVEAVPATVENTAMAITLGGTVQVNGAYPSSNQLGSLEIEGVAVAESGGGGFAYELMAYAIADLTATNKYTLMATGAGNYLRRAILDAPDTGGEGIDHPAGMRFAVVGPGSQGIIKMTTPAQYVGQALYYKICSFNTFGGSLQSLGDVEGYAYTPSGIPGG